MELALSLPSALKVRGLSTKAVLRRGGPPSSPAAILRRRKRGLSVPIASWINQGLRSEVDRLLAPERIAAQGWFRPEAVGALLTEHRAGTANHARRLWPLVMFQGWHERWA